MTTLTWIRKQFCLPTNLKIGSHKICSTQRAFGPDQGENPESGSIQTLNRGMKILTLYNAAASTAQFSPRKVCFSSRVKREIDCVVIEDILPTVASCKGGPQWQGNLQRLRKCQWSQCRPTWLGAFLSQNLCYYYSTIILDLLTPAPYRLSQLGSVVVLEAKVKE
jgi:hypothetical protein